MRKSRIDDCVSYLKKNHVSHVRFPHAVSELKLKLGFKEGSFCCHFFEESVCTEPLNHTYCFAFMLNAHELLAWDGLGGKDARDPRCPIWLHVFDPNSFRRKVGAK